jgi:LPS-assembly protein
VNAADKTPVLTLQSSNTKLFGKKSFLPFQTELSIGEFTDSTSKKQITRESFLFTFGNGSSGRYDSGYSSASDYSYSSSTFSSYGSDRSSSGTTGLTGSEKSVLTGSDSSREVSKQSALSISYNGRFKQGIYSNDTAQYTTGLNTTASYRFGTNLSMNLRYNYLDSHGFSPLSVDRQGRSNITTLDVDSRLTRNLSLAAGTGYDFFQDSKFGQSKWQMVNMRTEWSPAEWFQVRTYSTYDTSQEKLSNIRFDVGYKPGATFVGIGAKYDGIRHTWGNLSLFVDGFKMGRLKLSTLLIYNGYLKKFESRHFSFTYDLHCAEAIFQVLDNPTGYRSGTQFVFMIRLKAFPFNTPFGTGRTGQSLGLGYGRGGY